MGSLGGYDFKERVYTEVRVQEGFSRVIHPGLPRTEGSQDAELSVLKPEKSGLMGTTWPLQAVLYLQCFVF